MTKIPVTSPRSIRKTPISAAGIRTAWHVYVQSEFPQRGSLISVDDPSIPLRYNHHNHSCVFSASLRAEAQTPLLSDLLLLLPPLGSRPVDTSPAPHTPRLDTGATETRVVALHWLTQPPIKRCRQQQADGVKVENKDDSLLTEFIQNNDKEIILSIWSMTPNKVFFPHYTAKYFIGK